MEAAVCEIDWTTWQFFFLFFFLRNRCLARRTRRKSSPTRTTWWSAANRWPPRPSARRPTSNWATSPAPSTTSKSTSKVCPIQNKRRRAVGFAVEIQRVFFFKVVFSFLYLFFLSSRFVIVRQVRTDDFLTLLFLFIPLPPPSWSNGRHSSWSSLASRAARSTADVAVAVAVFFVVFLSPWSRIVSVQT